MLTSSITVEPAQADEIRALLTARVRLEVKEKRHWFFWRVFTVTGPADAVREAMREAEEIVVRDLADGQCW